MIPFLHHRTATTENVETVENETKDDSNDDMKTDDDNNETKTKTSDDDEMIRPKTNDKNEIENSKIMTTSMKSEHKMMNLDSPAYKMMIAYQMIKISVIQHQKAKVKLNREMYSWAQSSAMSDSCSFKIQRMDFIDGNLHSAVFTNTKSNLY